MRMVALQGCNRAPSGRNWIGSEELVGRRRASNMKSQDDRLLLAGVPPHAATALDRQEAHRFEPASHQAVLEQSSAHRGDESGQEIRGAGFPTACPKMGRPVLIRP